MQMTLWLQTGHHSRQHLPDPGHSPHSWSADGRGPGRHQLPKRRRCNPIADPLQCPWQWRPSNRRPATQASKPSALFVHSTCCRGMRTCGQESTSHRSVRAPLTTGDYSSMQLIDWHPKAACRHEAGAHKQEHPSGKCSDALPLTDINSVKSMQS